MTERTYLSCAETAKLIRTALKKAFPGVKFAVRSKTYSGGASIDVSWTDGPATAAVEKIAKVYAGAGFDGMIDLKYHTTAWLMPDGSATFARSSGTEGSAGIVSGFNYDKPDPAAIEVNFGADYVFCTKHYSMQVYTAATKAVCDKYDVPMPEILQYQSSGSAYINGYTPVKNADNMDLQTLVYRELRSEDRTFREAEQSQ